MFRRKNKGAFDDTPSQLAPQPVTSTEGTQEPNYAGSVRGQKYKITQPENQNIPVQGVKEGERVIEEDDAYPIPEGDIDFYSVDTRIWKKVAWMIANSPGGGDGPPYDDTKLWEETVKLQGEIDALKAELEAMETFDPDLYTTNYDGDIKKK